MTAALLILAAVALFAVVALVSLLIRVVKRTDVAPPLRGRTVTVNTRKPDDQTIRGVLIGEWPDRLMLAGAVYVTGDGETDLGGIAHVPTSNVAWIQEH